MVRSFKVRVRDAFITSAKTYEDNLVNKVYVIFAKDFKFNKYYTVLAKEDNFLHLTGVITNLSPKVFLTNILLEIYWSLILILEVSRERVLLEEK